MTKKPRYRSVDEMLALISEPNRSACRKLLDENRERFQSTPGSSHNHQAWPGGYFDHIQEAMNIGVVVYKGLSALRPLQFSLSDLLLVVFLHDLEKPWKYGKGKKGVPIMKTKKDRHDFRLKKINEYNIVLTPEQENGIRYAEGEHDDYSSKYRVMNPLASLAHACDVFSARLWPEHPLAKGEYPWLEAGRIRD